MTRREKWQKLDTAISGWRKLAPAFIQEITVGGLWSVQTLSWPRDLSAFGRCHRLMYDPPNLPDCEPFYNGWPGDQRGWMRFQSKEEARDFYKFASGLMSFEDYTKIEKGKLSDVRIDLDENGNFMSASDGQKSDGRGHADGASGT